MRARRWVRRLVALSATGLLAACSPGTMVLHGDDRAYEVSAAWIAGRPAVAWYGGGLAREAVFLRQADASGRWGPALQLTDATRDAYEPSLQEIEGDALVAWYEQHPAAAGTIRHQAAMLARFDSTGRRRWQRELSDPLANGRNPVVRVRGSVIAVAWLEQRDEVDPVLRVASLDAGGNWLRAAQDVAAAGRETWNLNAALGPEGALHVVFDAGRPGAAKELHWVRVAGSEVAAARVSREDSRDSVYPDIAIDGGRFALTWFDSRDGNEEVYLRCGQLGQAGSAIPQAPLDGADARRVTRTPTASRGAYLAWHHGQIELAWTEGEGRRHTLWQQRFDQECRPMGVARRVRSLGRDAGVPSLSASPSGLLLAWNGQRGDPAATVADRGSSVVLVRVAPARAVSPNAAAR